MKLAELTQDIDLIIGGHTHTFLDKPTVMKNAIGQDVLVNQVGCYGINLGRIDFYFDNNKSKSAQGKSIAAVFLKYQETFEKKNERAINTRFKTTGSILNRRELAATILSTHVCYVLQTVYLL